MDCNTIYIGIISALFIILYFFSLDIKLYPRYIIESFYESYIRVLAYLILYVLSYISFTVSLVYMIILLLFHVDYTNLTRYVLV